MEWSQVDLERRVAWVNADQAKGRRSIRVSLNSTAVAVLVRQLGKHAERVFTYNGKAVAWANTLAWRQALKRAGIEPVLARQPRDELPVTGGRLIFRGTGEDRW